MFKKIPASKLSIAKRTPVFGVGVNDSPYKISTVINGKRYKCKAYLRWVDMLKRAYSKKYHKAQPTYVGVTVSDEWLAFSNFEKWYVKNSVKGFQLDKDLLNPGNKTYSSDNCLFVPSSINKLIDTKIINHGLPRGVSRAKHGQPFFAQITIDSNNVWLGKYDTTESAHNSYVKAKNNEIKRKMIEYPDLAKHLKNHLTLD